MARPRVCMLLVVGMLAFYAAPGGWAQDRPHGDRPDRPGRPERSERPERPKERAERRAERPDRPQERPAERRPDRPDRRYEDRPPVHVTRPPGHRDDPGGTTLRTYPPQSRSREQARAWERENSWRPHGAWGEHGSWREHQARQWQLDHRSWGERGGYGGYYIPAPQFRLHFGPNHGFRIHARPTIYRGYPRFRHNGFWFMLVDPWPEFWSETWYQTDDLYIDYSDGYYLYNRRHPGVGIAISISL